MSDERALVRPSIPPAVWGAAALWLGVVGAEAAAWAAYVNRRPFDLVPGFVVASALVGVAWLVRRHGALPLGLIGLAAGLAVGSVFWAGWDARVRWTVERPSTAWVAEAVTDPQPGSFGQRSQVVSGGVRLKVGWRKNDTAPESGRQVRFFGSAKPPGDDEFGRRDHRSGVCGSVSARGTRVLGSAHSLRGAIEPWRTRARNAISEVPGPGGDLLAGVVLGDRRRLDGTPAEGAFRTTGLTHLVAVSGGHLVVVAAVVGWVLARMRTRRWVSAAIVIGMLGLYVVASGVQPSAVRAWLMATVVVVIGARLRRSDGLGALASAACVGIAAWPPTAFDMGFQLSVAAVGGLLLFARLTDRWVGLAMPRPVRFASEPVAMTLVAQAATLPLTVAAFGMLSLISPLANVLAGPLVSLALLLGLLGLAMEPLVPSAALVVLKAAGAAGALCSDVATWLASWPRAAIPLGVNALACSVAFAAVGVVLWAWWPSPERLRARRLGFVSLALTAALAIGPPPPVGCRLVVLDVGQGDAILVRDGSHALLVDTGPEPKALRDALIRQGVRTLDAVLVTHLHDDHYGGLEALQGVVQVRSASVAAGALDDGGAAISSLKGLVDEVGELSAGDRITTGRITLDVLWPITPVDDGSQNESSLVILVSGPSFRALLTGDAESEVLDAVMAAEGLADVDVYKVGHHGSAGAVSPAALAALRPEIAAICVGTGNRYGHPVPATVDQLERSGSRVLRTDRSGDITIRFGARGYAVDTQRAATTMRGYATLVGALYPLRNTENDGSEARRTPPGLPDRLRAADARRGGALPPEEPRWQRGRLGLQHAGLRGRQCFSGRRHRRMQHHPVRIRPPPGDRARYREAQ